MHVRGSPQTGEIGYVGRRIVPYFHGIIVCMKKTLHIDERLLRDARLASGAKTDTETVRLGLEALVRRGAYERLRALRGSEPQPRGPVLRHSQQKGLRRAQFG